MFHLGMLSRIWPLQNIWVAGVRGSHRECKAEFRFNIAEVTNDLKMAFQVSLLSGIPCAGDGSWVSHHWVTLTFRTSKVPSVLRSARMCLPPRTCACVETSPCALLAHMVWRVKHHVSLSALGLGLWRAPKALAVNHCSSGTLGFLCLLE